MSFFSILKLSLHSLLNNKLRTLLTILVISVVAFVMIFLFGIVSSFYSSVRHNVSYTFNDSGEVISVSKVNKDNNSYNRLPLSVEEVETVINTINIDDGYVSYVSFFDYTNGNLYGGANLRNSENNTGFSVFPFYENSNPFIGTENYLVAGRMWNSSDKNSLNIWLDTSAMNKFQLGDQIDLQRNGNNSNFESIQESVGVFTVAGFLDLAKDSNNYSSLAFIPYTHFNSTYEPVTENFNMEKLNIFEIYAVLLPQGEEFYGADVENYFVNLKDSLEQITFQQGSLVVNGRVIGTLEFVSLMTLVILGVAAFVSLIIILLSIGSVANTLKISAEQNRRFFGMMKAIGMKNKSLRSILTGQIVIMAILGTCIAYGFSILFIKSAYSIISSLISGMFSKVDEIICVISPLIPLVIAIVFILFVLLATRSSLRKIVQMDVISVINEVN